MPSQYHKLCMALERVELKFPAIPTKLELVLHGGDVLLRVLTTTRERTTGETVTGKHEFRVANEMTMVQFVRFAEQRALSTWIHEFEEAFHLDGKRLREPHPSTTYRFILYGPDDHTIP